MYSRNAQIVHPTWTMLLHYSSFLTLSKKQKKEERAETTKGDEDNL